MKPQIFIKIIIDFLMLISLFMLMAYELIGAAAHEWIGTIMFLLVVTHNILNRKWWNNLLKGKYNPIRIVKTIIICLVFFGMLMQMVSGIMLSRYVFSFLPISGGISFTRTLHMIGAYWSFAFMSLHLGFHGSLLMGILKKVTHTKESSRIRTFILRIIALLISFYGIYAFWKRDIGSYMLLKNQFVFFNFDEPLILFFIDYFAISVLFIIIGYYIMKGVTKLTYKNSSVFI